MDRWWRSQPGKFIATTLHFPFLLFLLLLLLHHPHHQINAVIRKRWNTIHQSSCSVHFNRMFCSPMMNFIWFFFPLPPIFLFIYLFFYSGLSSCCLWSHLGAEQDWVTNRIGHSSITESRRLPSKIIRYHHPHPATWYIYNQSHSPKKEKKK